MTFEDGIRRIGWAIAFFVGGFIFPLLWAVAAFIFIAWWSDFFGQGSSTPEKSAPPKKPPPSPAAPRPSNIGVGSPTPAQDTSDLVNSANKKKESLRALIASLESSTLDSTNTSVSRKTARTTALEASGDESSAAVTGNATRESIGYDDINQALRELENQKPSAAKLRKPTRLRDSNPKQVAYKKFISKFRPSCFYHFTDTRNIGSIIGIGALLSSREMEKIGVFARAPGGSKESRISDKKNGMDAYVHLCFSDQNPMEWTAKQDGRIADSAFLEIDPSVLLTEGVLLTPGFSNAKGMVPVTLEQALEEFDFEILYQRIDWRDENQKKRIGAARKYEILVPRSIPSTSIINIDSFRMGLGSNEQSIARSWDDDVPF